MLIFIPGAILWTRSYPADGDEKWNLTARQQKATVESALANYIAQREANGATVEEIRRQYNAINGDLGRLEILTNFLDQESYAHFHEHSTTDRVQSAKMKDTTPAQYLHFADWAGRVPDVELVDISVLGIRPRRQALSLALAGFLCALLAASLLHRKSTPERSTRVSGC